jgi:hypothetical protein
MNLKIDVSSHSYHPGEFIHGVLRWQDAEGTGRIDIRLIWYTSGKGTADVGVAGSESVQGPGTTGEKAFSFVAPNYPCSYSGSLISVSWAIEAIAFPQRFAERTDLVIGPDAREISPQLNE